MVKFVPCHGKANIPANAVRGGGYPVCAARTHGALKPGFVNGDAAEMAHGEKSYRVHEYSYLIPENGERLEWAYSANEVPDNAVSIGGYPVIRGTANGELKPGFENNHTGEFAHGPHRVFNNKYDYLVVKIPYKAEASIDYSSDEIKVDTSAPSVIAQVNLNNNSPMATEAVLSSTEQVTDTTMIEVSSSTQIVKTQSEGFSLSLPIPIAESASGSAGTSVSKSSQRVTMNQKRSSETHTLSKSDGFQQKIIVPANYKTNSKAVVRRVNASVRWHGTCKYYWDKEGKDVEEVVVEGVWRSVLHTSIVVEINTTPI